MGMLKNKESGVDEMDLGELLRQMGALDGPQDGPVDPAADVNATKEDLVALAKRYNEYNVFSPGDLVQWKEGMKMTKAPGYGEAVVVVEVLSRPIRSAELHGSPYYGALYDLRLGWVDHDGDFVVYCAEGARFEKIKE